MSPNPLEVKDVSIVADIIPSYIEGKSAISPIIFIFYSFFILIKYPIEVTESFIIKTYK